MLLFTLLLNLSLTSALANDGKLSGVAEPDQFPPFKLGLNYQILAVDVEIVPGSNDEDRVLTFAPAESPYVGIVLGYRWLSGSWSFAIPAEREVRDVEGTSRYQNYRLAYFIKNLGGEISYTRYFGYNLRTSPLTRINDFETLGYGATFFYAFNPEKYSMAAAMDQSDMQKEPGGAWQIFAQWRQQRISSNQPWVPVARQAEFGTDALTRWADNLSISAGPGYGYLWMRGDFFASGAIALGPSYRRTRYQLAGGDWRVHASAGFNALIRLAFGFNVKNFLGTISAYNDQFNFATRSFTIRNSVYGAALTAAVRF